MCEKCDDSLEVAMMAMAGFKFAKRAGQPVERKAIMEAILEGAFFPVPNIYNMASAAFFTLLEHDMITQAGELWAWNPDYRPAPDDWWLEDDEFVGPGGGGD